MEITSLTTEMQPPLGWCIKAVYPLTATLHKHLEKEILYRAENASGSFREVEFIS